MQRTAEIKRKTTETDIELSLCLDGSGIAEIQTGSGFLNHMLTSFARHGRFDLTVRCTGDTWVDYHHSVTPCVERHTVVCKQTVELHGVTSSLSMP